MLFTSQTTSICLQRYMDNSYMITYTQHTHGFLFIHKHILFVQQHLYATYTTPHIQLYNYIYICHLY